MKYIGKLSLLFRDSVSLLIPVLEQCGVTTASTSYYKTYPALLRSFEMKTTTVASELQCFNTRIGEVSLLICNNVSVLNPKRNWVQQYDGFTTTASLSSGASYSTKCQLQMMRTISRPYTNMVVLNPRITVYTHGILLKPKRGVLCSPTLLKLNGSSSVLNKTLHSRMCTLGGAGYGPDDHKCGTKAEDTNGQQKVDNSDKELPNKEIILFLKIMILLLTDKQNFGRLDATGEPKSEKELLLYIIDLLLKKEHHSKANSPAAPSTIGWAKLLMVVVEFMEAHPLAMKLFDWFVVWAPGVYTTLVVFLRHLFIEMDKHYVSMEEAGRLIMMMDTCM